MALEGDTAPESTTVDSGASPEAPVNDPAPNGETSEPSPGVTENPTDGTQAVPDGEPGGTTEKPSGNTQDDEPTGKESTELPEELYFNGHKVQVEVPDELSSHLTEAGVDTNKVIAELYGEGSDFTLSEETRAPLDEKFGKPLVDTFLNALKAQNEHALHLTESQKEQAEQAQQAAIEWSNELVGGEEGWESLSNWAEKNLEDSNIEAFNKAMESGDKYIQELAIKDLYGKMKNQTGDTDYSLVSGEASTTDQGGALSSQEYLAEMTNPAFTQLKGQDRVRAQQALDARRRMGLKRGI